MRSEYSPHVPVLIVFVLASLISLLRILVSNKDALSNLVWAEDGLFPLCIQAHGYFQCLFDPYEGYFLFLSRTLALPVSLFSQEQWPLVTNAVAAVSFGFLSALITWLLLRAQFSRTVAIGSGIAAVMLPIVGLETINTAGSAYMLLLVAGAVAVSFRFTPRLPIYVSPLILFVTAITIPSAIVLLLPLGAAWFTQRERQERKGTLLSVTALSLGLIIQFSIMLSAQNRRSVEITIESVREWVLQYPAALLSTLPIEVQLDGSGQLNVPIYRPSFTIGAFVLLVVGGFAVYLLTRRSGQLRGAGWLIVSGFLVGTIPAISNYSNNRYFVVPVITFITAFFIWWASAVGRKYSSVTLITIVVILGAWIPNFGASKIRTVAAPIWGDMLVQVQEQCRLDQNSTAIYIFSPNWPFADADFKGPTSNTVGCAVVK